MTRLDELKHLELMGEVSVLQAPAAFPVVIEGRPLLVSDNHGQAKPLIPIADFAYFRAGRRIAELSGPSLSAIEQALVEHIHHVEIVVGDRA